MSTLLILTVFLLGSATLILTLFRSYWAVAGLLYLVGIRMLVMDVILKRRMAKDKTKEDRAWAEREEREAARAKQLMEIQEAAERARREQEERKEREYRAMIEAQRAQGFRQTQEAYR